MHAECAVKMTVVRAYMGVKNVRRADISNDNLAIKHVLQCGDAISTVVYSFYPFTRVSWRGRKRR